MSSLYTQAAANAASSSSSNSISANGTSSDMFTSLLVAQIQYQNPLEPTDASEFVTQLTQLSQMESLQSLSTQAGATAGLITGLQALGFGGLVGSEVGVSTDSLTLDGKSTVSGRFTLDATSTGTQLVLTNDAGKQYTVDLGKRAAGEVEFTLDPAAAGLPAGHYTVAVTASTGEKPTLEVDGTLNSVRLSASGSLLLDVEGVGEVDPDSVTTFTGRNAANAI